MTFISGNGESYIECDHCGKRVDVSDQVVYGAPEGWYFVATGTSRHLESADQIYHFCAESEMLIYVAPIELNITRRQKDE